MKPRLFILALSILAAFPFAPEARAQVFQGPVSSALAGTGRAGLDDAAGVFLNPALVTLIPSDEFDLLYRDGEITDGQHRQAWGVGAADNTADVMFPGSLHYVKMRETGRAPEPVNRELWHAAVGQEYGGRFAVGVSVYRLQDTLETQRYTQWNGSLGFLWMANKSIGFAYVLDNPVLPSKDIPLSLQQLMEQSAGFYATIGDVARVRVDVSREERDNPGKKLSYMASLESKMSHYLLFRAGLQYDDQTVQRLFTAGFGFEGPRLKIDYSFEKYDHGGSGALHSVDMRMSF